ncbi:unnamed protein product [Mytilus edulis]|uniref:Endonuclease/exonuclease/phosphatase domain-containing protein n=1 Tax=Mytilus edulis TaxID=6550 RepID=A0A8S3V1Z2_MYTED|nr:unnamed protein product [Mytilus edulis]
MRENLLFGGILEDPREKDDYDNIETETVLKKFIKEKLKINEEIKFHIVHRLRPRKDAKPRTIVAKFESRKDRNKVLRAAPAKLKETSFSVFEQYPYEMVERRNVLWPIFKREQRLGNHARLKEDKLYVNGHRIYPEDVIEAQKNASNVPNNPSQDNMYPSQQGSQFLREHFGSRDESRADSEFVLWVKVDIPMQLTKIMFGCIYVPPENSRYSSKDAFDEIETELITLKDQSTATALLGDFNARTGSLCDYIIPDDELSKILNYDGIDEIDRCLYDYYNLCLYNVSLQRSSEDKGRINVYGNKLLQLCKNNCLYIANGRIGNDKNMGKVTSKETSLVDYLIVSGDLFPYITEFEVIDFDSLFSDIHCRLRFNLSAMLPDDLLDKNNSPNVPSKHIRWIGDKRDQFVDSVESKLTIDNLSNQLDTLDITNENFQTDLNELVESLNKICKLRNKI